MADEMLDKLLFPHAEVRDIQRELISDVNDAISNRRNLIAHAPTGLGKTASTLPIALAHAIEKDLVVFFLTSRHTQHKIAIDTLREVKKKHNRDFVTIDIIGKRHMCPSPAAQTLGGADFLEFCKLQAEEGKCDFYNNTRDKTKPTVDAKFVMDKLKTEMPCSTEQVMNECSRLDLCPYEISMMLAPKAKVIVSDYYYIFNDHIRTAFFKKAGFELDKCIIIIDEGHNVPDRLRELMTVKVSTVILDRAAKEARKFGFKELASNIESFKIRLWDLSRVNSDIERLIARQDLVDKIENFVNYDQFVSDLESAATDIREKQRASYVGSIYKFLGSWLGADKGYARILQKVKDGVITLSYRCLNPLAIAEPVVKNCYSAIIMSGTLTPTSMFKELLGFPKDTVEKSYPSPFPKENRLALIVPETTTKFTERSDDMYKRISEKLVEITDNIPGNSVVFFPSYFIRDKVNNTFLTASKKTVFSERQEMTKEDKLETLENFKRYKNVGAVMLAVSAGNFSEGIDLPDILKCVIIVGLPLQKPDLETQELIKHYDEVFGKGWDYGYLFPAFNKCLQGAGRCIRSSTDRGVIVFLDERFAWNNYFRCFPSDYNVKVMRSYYMDMVKGFFAKPLL